MLETFSFAETVSCSSYFLQQHHHPHHPPLPLRTATTSLSKTGVVAPSYHHFASSTALVYSDDLCCPVPRRNSMPLVSWAFNKKKREDVLRMSSESTTTPDNNEEEKEPHYDCWETYNELEQILQNAPNHFSSWQSRDGSDSGSGSGRGSGSGSGSGSGGISHTSSTAAVDGRFEESELSSDSNEDEYCLPSDIGKIDSRIPFEGSSVNSISISSSLSSPSCVKMEDDLPPALPLSTDVVEDSTESNDATFARQILTDTFSSSGLFVGGATGAAAAMYGLSPLSLTSPSVRRKRRTTLRPQLGISTSSLSFIPERSDQSQESITPPMRVPNPLPFNLAFGSKVSHGPEFGLLSVSPPSGEDEDTLLRRARVMSFQKPPPHPTSTLSTVVPPASSEYLMPPKITKVVKPQGLPHIRDGRVYRSHNKREGQAPPPHSPQQPSFNTAIRQPGTGFFTTDMDWNESDVLF